MATHAEIVEEAIAFAQRLAPLTQTDDGGGLSPNEQRIVALARELVRLRLRQRSARATPNPHT
jgi:hypothetical protein